MPATYRLTYDRNDNAAELAAILDEANADAPAPFDRGDFYDEADAMGDCFDCRRMLENCECGDHSEPYWNEIEKKWEF